MTRSEKVAVVEQLKDKFDKNPNFYFADSSALTVEQINVLRAECFEKGIEIKVIKNSLAKKALESFDESRNFQPLLEALKGPTTVMISEVANVPAKVIKEFRKSHDKPVLKAAYIDSDIFIGDENVDILAALKSKEELVGDILLLLQSPMKNVIGSLNSGEQTIAGLVKTLESRGE